MKPEMKEPTGIPTTKAYATRYSYGFLAATLLAGSVGLLSSQHSAFAVGHEAADPARQGGRNVAETMVLENSAGLKWELVKTTNGWALGTI
jgi:hypothetical protein